MRSAIVGEFGCSGHNLPGSADPSMLATIRFCKGTGLVAQLSNYKQVPLLARASITGMSAGRQEK
jgi:hypothetical protein